MQDATGDGELRLEDWLDEVSADPQDSGLLAEIERLRRAENATDGPCSDLP